MVVSIIGMATGVILLNSPKGLRLSVSADSYSCTGSWTCTCTGGYCGSHGQMGQSYTYQCSGYSSPQEVTCTGGGNSQGNYCQTSNGWTRTGGCTWNVQVIPTSTPIPGSNDCLSPFVCVPGYGVDCESVGRNPGNGYLCTNSSGQQGVCCGSLIPTPTQVCSPNQRRCTSEGYDSCVCNSAGTAEVCSPCTNGFCNSAALCQPNYTVPLGGSCNSNIQCQSRYCGGPAPYHVCVSGPYLSPTPTPVPASVCVPGQFIGCYTDFQVVPARSYIDECNNYGTAVTRSACAQNTWCSEGGQTCLPVPTTPPAPAPSITGIAVGCGKVTIAWKSVGKNINYLVERCQGSLCTNFSKIGSTTSLLFTDKNFIKSATYRYRVGVYNSLTKKTVYSTPKSAYFNYSATCK